MHELYTQRRYEDNSYHGQLTQGDAIMLTNIPDQIRSEIIQLLKADNFRAAKLLYENWLSQR